METRQETKIRSLCKEVIVVLDKDADDPGEVFDKLFIELLRYDFHTHDSRELDFWFLNLMDKIAKVHKRER